MTDGLAKTSWEQKVPKEYKGPRVKINFRVEGDAPLPITDIAKQVLAYPKFQFGVTKHGDKDYIEWQDSEGIINKAWGHWEVVETGGNFNE